MQINKFIRFKVKTRRIYNFIYKNLEAFVLGKDCYNVGDHDWRYNFPSIPNKRICTVCKRKELLNLGTFEWGGSFEDHAGRTDKELIEQWVH